MKFSLSNNRLVSWVAIAFAVFTLLGFNNLSAPRPSRIGYVSISSLLVRLPEFQANKSAFDSLRAELEEAFNKKVKDYQLKQKEFIRDSASLNQVIKADKKNELISLSKSIQDFEQSATQEIALMDSVKMRPIFSKVEEAIKHVADKGGYTHVINSDIRSEGGSTLLLFAKEDGDVSDLVLEEYKILDKE
ncbi:MAG: OmpH family outer membrane protein [Bacteroidota bacterium]